MQLRLFPGCLPFSTYNSCQASHDCVTSHIVIQEERVSVHGQFCLQKEHILFSLKGCKNEQHYIHNGNGSGNNSCLPTRKYLIFSDRATSTAFV